MAIKSLAQTLKDLTTGIKNTITGITGSNATLTIMKGNGTTNTVTVNNVANATNADKLDGYHYTDIINNVKSSVSSGGMGAPNWGAKISLNNSQNYTAPKNGYFISSVAISISLYVNNIILLSGISITVPIGAGDIIKYVIISGSSNEGCIYVPCQ